MGKYKSQMLATANTYGGLEGRQMRAEWVEAQEYNGVCALGHDTIYRPAVGIWCVETDRPKVVCGQ